MQKLLETIIIKGLGYDKPVKAIQLKRYKRLALYKWIGYNVWETFLIRMRQPQKLRHPYSKVKPLREEHPTNNEFGTRDYDHAVHSLEKAEALFEKYKLREIRKKTI